MAANASKSNTAAATGLHVGPMYVHIFWTKQGRNSNEISFCMFSYNIYIMGNYDPMPYSVLS